MFDRCSVAFVESNGRRDDDLLLVSTVSVMDIIGKGNINILLTSSIWPVSLEGSLRTARSPRYRRWLIFQTDGLPADSLNKVNSADRSPLRQNLRRSTYGWQPAKRGNRWRLKGSWCTELAVLRKGNVLISLVIHVE